MGDNFDLKDFLLIIRKKILFIISLVILASVLSAYYSYNFLTPQYQAATQILIKSGGSNGEKDNQYISTYKEIIRSSKILDIVAGKLGNYSSPQLRQKVQVSSSNLLLIISATDSDPQEAAKIANKVAEVFINENPSILNLSGVEILIPASTSDNISPVSPSPIRNIAIAIALALFIGIVITFLLEFFNNSIKDEDDIKRNLNVPVLGVISKYNRNLKAREVRKQWSNQKKVEKSNQINLS
ncbi:YveK family protein [Neobacillus citreus]|uniref:Capsular biosynthesis protein n=1 Tax=Neobacillus citreus TaxID=2833578 RepID=A0A942T1I0_9BACI|nr:Wzz/FepE/Etk N-terminal domain-containing protein [Neobacillus citreus]MCH6265995.1 Wzz/FepE/Etk N-terminal domain-containing protein [Neobacillus citreus]